MRFDYTWHGTFYATVCTDLSVADALARVNVHKTTALWEVDGVQKCGDDPRCQHVMLTRRLDGLSA